MSSTASIFNVEQFLGTTTDQIGPTFYVRVPDGEYRASITKIDGKRIEAKKGPNTGTQYTVLDITWQVHDDAIAAKLNMEKPTARQSLFVDLTPEGGLDFGTNKNVQLSRLRDAVGQMRKGRAWAPSHLLGQSATVLVKGDVNDETGEERAIVTKVAKLT